MRADTQQWWDQAQADLRSAQVLLTAGQFYGVSFFAQQAAEKALKALYVERRGHIPPRTHDLEFLAFEVVALTTLQTELGVLAPVFDAARYPDNGGIAPVHAIGHIEAQDHFDAAERIVTWIGGQL
ncbi:MAG: HEPN domain-containing protein [Dehalococcoidia bacterium]